VGGVETTPERRADDGDQETSQRKAQHTHTTRERERGDKKGTLPIFVELYLPPFASSSHETRFFA